LAYVMCCKWFSFYVWQAGPEVKPKSVKEQYLRTFIKRPFATGAGAAGVRGRRSVRAKLK